VGQAIRFLSRNTLLQYPEEKSGFHLPVQYTTLLNQGEKTGFWQQSTSSHAVPIQASSEDADADDSSSGQNHEDEMEALGMVKSHATARSERYSTARMREEEELAMEKTKSIAIQPQKTSDGVVLVDWYTTDDPENPQNWSQGKKAFTMFLLCAYTWIVYSAGPIWAVAADGIVEHFHVSHVAASLGLSLYILAYGIGDLLFSPLSEIPIIGRNPVYYLTFIVFWAFSFAPATVNTFGGLLALRFFLGFFGSPALANGGATVGDLYQLIYIPHGLCWWVFSAWAGPAIAPVIGGFAAQAKGWRWPMWEVVWMASPVLLLHLFFMPETSAATILLKRAKRLRKLTGSPLLQAQSEIDQRNLSASEILTEALIRPVEIMLKDPSIFFVNLYTGYFYGVFYTFFEVFPLVFPPLYGFNLGQTGLAFLSCLVGVIIAISAYTAYLQFYLVPDNLKNGFREQEHRLVPAIFGSFLITIGQFVFAWTARTSIHWVVPLIGVGIFTIGHFFTMQSLFVYIPFSYPEYAASLFASNSVWRSATAGGSVVFARPLFINVGIDKGVTVLAGLSVAGIFGTIALYLFGKKLRARSKFAQS
jgi:DHA1 family multidrug resistance protein-like MFS transporter